MLMRGIRAFLLIAVPQLAGALMPSAVHAATVAGTTPGALTVSESGAAIYRIPIKVPPGISGMEPKLELVYNSQAGNGLLGAGWSLSGLSAITRCPQSIAIDGVRSSVTYTSSDRFCLDGQRLIAVSAGAYGANLSEYRTEVDSFSQISASGTAGTGPASFTVKTKSGLTMSFGSTANALIEATGKTTAAVWALNEIRDAKNNTITIEYNEDPVLGSFDVSKITYGGSSANEISFTYVLRDAADYMVAYNAGSKTTLQKRLESINIKARNVPLRTYTLGYLPAQTGAPTRIEKITECAIEGATQNCLAPITFGSDYWNASNLANFALGPLTQTGQSADYARPYLDIPDWKFVEADINGDGRTDLLGYRVGTGLDNARYQVLLSNGLGGFTAKPISPLLPGYADTNWKLSTADVNGDGRADLIIYTVGSPGIKALVGLGSDSGTFTLVPLQTLSTVNYTNWLMTMADVNGDGRADMVAYKIDGSGLKTRVGLSNGDGTFSLLQEQSCSTSNFSDWALASADVNGDGLADLMAYYVGSAGLKVQALVSSGGGLFTTQSPQIYASTGYASWNASPADINGDGRADLLAFKVDASGLHTQVALSQADGTFAYQTLQNIATSDLGGWSAKVVDINGDGRSDLMVYYVGSAGLYGRPALVSGSGSFALQAWRNYATASYVTLGGTPWGLTIADITGDGHPDLIAYANRIYDQGSALPPLGDLVTQTVLGLTGDAQASSINNGAATSVLAYQPLTQSSVYTKGTTATFPLIDLQIPLKVVSAVGSPNGIGGMNTTTYSYGGLVAQQASYPGSGRGMLGFRWMRAVDSQGLASRQEFNQTWPYTGSVSKTEFSAPSGGQGNSGLLKRTSMIYAQSAGSAGMTVFPYLSQSTEETWDLSGAVLPSTTTSYQYTQSPQYGNPTTITVTNSDGSSKTTSNAYWPVSNWILGRLQRATVTSTKP